MFIMLYKVVLAFESVDKIVKCDHSNESYWAKLSCGAVYFAVQGGRSFESVDEILKCGNQMNVIAHWFLVKLFILAVQGWSDIWVCTMKSWNVTI